MKYHTGYFLTLSSKKFTALKYSDRLITDKNLTLISENYKGSNWKIIWEYSTKWNGLEFIIVADSFEIAQSVLFNVLCSSAVLDEIAPGSDDAHYPHEYGTIDDIKAIDRIKMPVRGFSSQSVPSYFSLTAKSSNDYKLENAIIKYQLSTEIYSQHSMDLHEVIDWTTTDYSYIQMRFAYAIILAYAVIEELGLEVKASQESPSIMPNKEWNPKVLENLIERLEKSNIDVDENIVWMKRGEEKEIEQKKPIKIIKLAEWADPPDYDNDFFISIQDGYVYLPDAINYISYLRSSISSHSVGKRIMGLSVFDVANAQHLARRLILEKIDMWK